MEERPSNIQHWLSKLDANEVLYLALRLGPFISSKELIATDGGYLVWHAIDDTEDLLTRSQLIDKLNGEWSYWQPDPRFG